MKGANAVKTASAARRAAQLGLWMALAIAISTLEGWLPTLPVPGAKPGPVSYTHLPYVQDFL